MAKKNAAVEAQVVPAGYVPALKKVYKEQIVEKLMKQFSDMGRGGGKRGRGGFGKMKLPF